MHDRTKTFFSYSVLAGVLSATGCGFNQQSRFQMSFLPPAPPAAVIDTDPGPAPIVFASVSLPDPLPAFVPVNLPAPKPQDPWFCQRIENWNLEKDSTRRKIFSTRAGNSTPPSI